LSEQARANLKRYAEWGFERLPVCIAKTQYSLTDDPKRMGAARGWTLHVTDVLLSAGAGFLVAVAGNMMLMPGLPRKPRALGIDVDDEGTISGV
jgi:formate--tetrahydrofolate ligase